MLKKTNLKQKSKTWHSNKIRFQYNLMRNPSRVRTSSQPCWMRKRTQCWMRIVVATGCDQSQAVANLGTPETVGCLLRFDYRYDDRCQSYG